MQKILMVLGAGPHQMSTIETALEMGLKVVAVDKNEDAVGFNIQHKSLDKLVLSIRDKESILEIAEAYPIDGIISPCADAGILTVGYINDKMGLKGPSFISSLAAHDKTIMTSCLNYTDIKTPRRYHPAHVKNYPIIVKPFNGVGSKGVYKVKDESDLTKKFDYVDYTTIIEEYIEGEVFTASIIMQNGVPTYYTLLDEVESPTNFGACMFTYPSKHDCQNDILAKCFEVVQSIGIKDGTVEVEGIIKHDMLYRDIYIIDVNPRMAGGFILDAHSYAGNIDWIEKSIQAVLGELIHIIPHTSEPFVIRYKGSEKEGIFTRADYSCETDPTLPAHRRRFIKFIGDKVSPCNTKETSSDQFIVAIYATGETVEQAFIKVALVYADIEIEVSSSEEDYFDVRS